MGIYGFLVKIYNSFLSLFPPQLQWVVTLIIVVGFVGAFISLVRHNIVALVVLILLLPFFLPVLQHFFADIYHFFLYLISSLQATTPPGLNT